MTGETKDKPLSEQIPDQNFTFDDLRKDFSQRCAQMNLLLKYWIDDIQAVDIVTATAETSEGLKAQIDTQKASLLEGIPASIRIRARTTMQLDGDYIEILPTKNMPSVPPDTKTPSVPPDTKTPSVPPDTKTPSVSIEPIQVDYEILAIHRENIKSALNNFSTNIKILTDGMVQIITSLKAIGLDKSI